MQRVHFTNDGVYGEFGKTFDADVALRVADAISAVAFQDASEQNEVYVAFDVREPSQAIAKAVASQLSGHGHVVKLARSYTSIPALNYALRTHPEARVGIMITGDHRRYDTLGIRIRDERGAAPHPSSMDAIEQKIPVKPADVEGSYSEVDFNTPFFEHAQTWGKKLSEKDFLFLVDTMYGCASTYAPELLRAYNLDVIELHGNVSESVKTLHPEVVEPWIDDLEYACSRTKCAAGVGLDGSANRAVVITPKGFAVSLAKVSALFMRYLVEKHGKTGLVLCPRTSSFIIKKQAEALGLEIRYVTKAERWAEEEVLPEGITMKDVLLAGDGIYSLIIPSLDPERDGFVIMVMLAEVLAAYGQSLEELLEELGESLGHSYYGHRDVRMEVGEFEMLKNVLPGLSPNAYFLETSQFVSHTDGLYVSFADDSWIYLRPSRTESLVHLYVEAPSKEKRNLLLEGGGNLIKRLSSDFA